MEDPMGLSETSFDGDRTYRSHQLEEPVWQAFSKKDDIRLPRHQQNPSNTASKN